MYKYEMIAEEIQKKIKDGTYPPDTRLPQEMEMCKIYDASRITIREAMELLVAKGLITKRRGAGTFVKAFDLFIGGSSQAARTARITLK